MQVTTQVVEGGARTRSPRRSVHLLLAAAAILATVAVPAATASAQTVPTVPCQGCGPGAPGDGTRPWSYTEFVCQPQRGFILVFGVGRNVSEPVNFSVGIAPAGGGVVPVRLVASGIQPGASRSSLLPAPNATGTMDVRIVGTGANSGRVLLDNTRELDCTCPDQPTTTSPTTSPTTVPEQVTTTVPEQVTTTEPGQTTTAPAVATSVARNTTIPGTLPETGSTNSSVALGGLLLLAVGIGAVLIGAFARRGPAEES
jgi:LPXTG-motif cell wall-anchored protein